MRQQTKALEKEMQRYVSPNCEQISEGILLEIQFLFREMNKKLRIDQVHKQLNN